MIVRARAGARPSRAHRSQRRASLSPRGRRGQVASSVHGAPLPPSPPAIHRTRRFRLARPGTGRDVRVRFFLLRLDYFVLFSRARTRISMQIPRRKGYTAQALNMPARSRRNKRRPFAPPLPCLRGRFLSFAPPLSRRTTTCSPGCSVEYTAIYIHL